MKAPLDKAMADAMKTKIAFQSAVASSSELIKSIKGGNKAWLWANNESNLMGIEIPLGDLNTTLTDEFRTIILKPAGELKKTIGADKLLVMLSKFNTTMPMKVDSLNKAVQRLLKMQSASD